MTRARDLIAFIGVLTLGVVGGLVFQAGPSLVEQPAYLIVVTALLAVGLLGSTSQVSVDELRQDGRRVLLAVSLGVLAKAVIIGGLLHLAFREPAYLILGVVVAQIDPLATAANQAATRLSSRARSLMSAWASFDDPVTTLLAVYLSAAVLAATGRAGVGPAATTGSFWAYAATFALNLLFAGAVWLIWRRFLSRTAEPPHPGRKYSALHIVAFAGLAVLVAIAVGTFWMLGLALIGLFYRPALGKLVLPRLTRSAYFLAALALGLTLVDGVNLAAGLVLGVLAYLSQVVVGLVVTTGLPPADRGYIALGQQNGITAIILALVLEPTFPGTIGVVAPAILVINLLHAGANAAWERFGLRPAPAPQPRPITGPLRASPASAATLGPVSSTQPVRRNRG